MVVPNIDTVNRSREYNSYTDEQRDRVVYNYLFAKGMSNRNIDEKILGLNPVESRGCNQWGFCVTWG